MRNGNRGKGMGESQQEEQGHLFGVAEFSNPTEVRLPQLYTPGTISSEDEFAYLKGARARTHAHTHYAYSCTHGQPHRPAQAETLSTHASTDRSCSPSLPADQDEGALVGN